MNNEDERQLVSRPILFDSGELKVFDAITGHGKRSETIRGLVKRFNKSYVIKQTKVIEDQLKLEEKNNDSREYKKLD